jgi:hypothetical protein
MKKIIIILLVGLLTPQLVQGQGTIYLSNLWQPFAGSEAVGSDSWLAIYFATGNPPFGITGYNFNSIQLEMTAASGNPDGFTVAIYPVYGYPGSPPNLGSSLGTLNGSSNPSTAEIYSYTPTSNLTLLPDAGYFIVVTAGTAITDGSYELSESITYATSSDNWTGGPSLYSDSDGMSWTAAPNSAYLYYQFAISATPIPEPSPSLLLLLGSGILFYVRRAFHR